MVTDGTLSFFDPTADFYPDLFGMQLYYDGGNSSVGGDAQFNGNISWVKWKVQGETDQQYYGYKYDHLNRITQANYKDFSNCTWSNIDRYSMPAVSYDDNGNILTLQQKGLIDATPSNVFDLMDNLQYFYSGNRLIGVHDAVADHADMNDFADYGQEGTIVEGTTSTHEYLYDNNGNMKKDNGKGITSIVYNSLNLPAIVMYGSTKRVEYTYTASGEKVKQRIVNTTSSIVKHYISGFNYEEVAGTPTLQYFGTREGRVINDAGTLKYEFNLTDHLGNVRVSFRDIDGQAGIDKDDITDRDDYYPYGLTFAGLATIVQSENPYEYNGKELQNGPNGKILNWNDYGSRMYDPQVGRWIVVDPMAEHSYAMSPFLYANSNPVNFYDPDGKLPLPLITGAIGGVIGAAVAGGLAASQGKPWKAAAAGGFAAGFITGSGAGLLTGLAAPAAAGLTAGIGFISASVGSAVTQTGELLAGDRKDISTEELAFDGLIGIPSSFMGNAGSQSLSKSILKRYGKGFKEVLMDNGMKNKEAKKVIQALNEYIGNNKNKALDAVEVTVKTGSIVVTEAAVSTTTEPVKEAILENKEEK